MSNRLPNFIIAGLYKDSLVITQETNTSAIQIKEQINDKKINRDAALPVPVKKWFLGDNKKNIIILVKDTTAVFINDEWLATLSKLLAACKLNLGDVAIINYFQNNVSLASIKEELKPQRVFMFDVTTNELQMPFSIPNYQVQQYGGCTFMCASGKTLSSSASTEAIVAEKRQLWEKLKIIFGL
jgi:hypothetical protein